MAYQKDRSLPEREIIDEEVLRADYQTLRVAYELQRDIGLELDIDISLVGFWSAPLSFSIATGP